HLQPCERRERRAGKQRLRGGGRCDGITPHFDREDRQAERARCLLVVEIAALGTILAAARHSTPVPHKPGRLVAAESEPAAGIPGQDAGDGAYPGGNQPGLEAPSSGPVAVVRGSGGDEDQAVERRRHARGKEQAELTTEAVSD